MPEMRGYTRGGDGLQSVVKGHCLRRTSEGLVFDQEGNTLSGSNGDVGEGVLGDRAVSEPPHHITLQHTALREEITGKRERERGNVALFPDSRSSLAHSLHRTWTAWMGAALTTTAAVTRET